MENVVLAVSIGERNKSEKYLEFFRENGVQYCLGAFGKGTATREILETLGIGSSDKFVIFSFMTMEKSKQVLKELDKKAHMSTIGVGISFTIPLESIEGLSTLNKLVGDVDLNKESEGYAMETENQLLVVVSNRGYTETVMDVARKAGAQGGTVVHARGSGLQNADKFFGTTIGAEKEVIFILTRKEFATTIMKAIKDEVGINTPSGAFSFSLPICDAVGIIEY